MRNNIVRRGIVAIVGAWCVLGMGSAFGGGFSTPIEVSPTSGPPGTTVTVTAFECGQEDINGDGIAPSAPIAFIPGTGQLEITIAGWGDAFNPFLGGTNDEIGTVTATFQVPNVAAGPYTIEALCSSVCPVSTGSDVSACSTDVGSQAFGPYPDGSFTVTALPTAPTTPAAPAVQAQATTTG